MRDRFLRQEQLAQLIVEPCVKDLIGKLRDFVPVLIDKWIDRDKLGV